MWVEQVHQFVGVHLFRCGEQDDLEQPGDVVEELPEEGPRAHEHLVGDALERHRETERGVLHLLQAAVHQRLVLPRTREEQSA